MSRSFRKPFGPICCIASDAMKKWRTQRNQSIRSSNEEIPNGNAYRKLKTLWDAPSDGKRYMGEDPKWTRK